MPTTNEISRGSSGRGLAALAFVVASAGCLFSSPFPTLGQIELHTVGDGFGMVYVTRTIPGGCDGGSGTDPCVLQSGCGGGGDGKYLCGVGYEPGYPVTLSASAAPGSSFQGWTVAVTPPNGAPTALPPDSSPTKDVSQGTHAKLDVSVRFSPIDAGAD